MVLRAIERVSPTAIFGKPWGQLTRYQQIELLAFNDIRVREETGNVVR